MNQNLQILVVDDELQSRALIKKLLTDFFPGTIGEEAADVTTALQKINNQYPDLIFLDVQMRGETGFDLLDKLPVINFDIIFTTAHSEFAVKAFRYSAIIDAHGVRTTVTDKFPSSQTSPEFGNLVSGVADVEFVGSTMYALLGGAGCSHGVAGIPNGIAKVNEDGSWTMIADLSAWQQSHPVAHPEEDDFEPDGTWYSMINVRGDLYAVEPNHGEMVKVTTGGSISRVVDISATQGHIVPTVVTYHGNFYVSNLNTFPITGGASSIFKITPDGTIKVEATGFNAVLGLVIDQQNRMYVLENTAGGFPAFPTPGLGRIVRVDPSGARTVIATGLNLPTGMTMGPDGKLYVSNWGFGPPPIGLGQILQIDLKN
jgi:CheY-like chemotaxis protein